MRSRFAASCVSGGPALFVAGLAIHAWLGASIGLPMLLGIGAGGLALSVAGLTAHRYPRAARTTALIALLGVAGTAAPWLPSAPMVTLLVGLALLYLIDALRPFAAPAEPVAAAEVRLSLRAVILGMVPWLVVRLVGLGPALAPVAGGLAGLMVTTVWVMGLPAGPGGSRWITRWLPPLVWLGGAALAAGLREPRLVGDLMWATLAVLLIARAPMLHQRALGLLTPVLSHPARLLVATFIALCTVGAVLLALPIAGADGDPLSLIDAAFTSVSAACVTGLVVVDTALDFSTTGKIFILILIQAGGLGIMTFSTAAVRLLGRRLSLRHEAAVAGLLSRDHRGDLFLALRRAISVTVAFEALGALLLAGAFLVDGDGLFTALGRAVFTAVSAFCNAGFALQSDNLIGYQGNPVVLHVVALLIIAGGLSPLAIAALPDLVRRRPAPLQVKVILAATGLLLVIGFVMILALDWGHGLAGLSWGEKLHNAWFQSVTTRTAGFNSVDTSQLSAATLGVMMALMFVGGAPGGTAGGIKVTSFWVLLQVVGSAVRGRTAPVSFGRRIPPVTVYRAAAIATIAALAVVIGTTMLETTQGLGLQKAAFEVVSALGTVGLSVGATLDLDGVGKGIIIALMFLGRVGPLTIFLLLSDPREASGVEYPEEGIEVG